jgi:hypothetical protein
MAVTERPSSLGNVLATNGLHATKLPPNSTSGRGYDDDPAAPGVDSAPHRLSNTKVFSLPGRIFTGETHLVSPFEALESVLHVLSGRAVHVESMVAISQLTSRDSSAPAEQ